MTDTELSEIYTPCIVCKLIKIKDMLTISTPDKLAGEMICKGCYDDLDDMVTQDSKEFD